MAKLRMGNQIRLSGEDAEIYLMDTGKNALPKTVEEHDHALEMAAQYWEYAGSAEGIFLAAMIRMDKTIPDDHIYSILDYDDEDKSPIKPSLYLVQKQNP